MFGPDWAEGCPSCSFVGDHLDGAVVHLGHRDVTFAAVSRAPFAKIAKFKQRMGWRFDWVSSHGSDFNFDYHVSYTPEQIASGAVEYNYAKVAFPFDEAHGLSVFRKDGEGRVYHTYSSYGRGCESLLTTYSILDLVPKGRDEEGLAFGHGVAAPLTTATTRSTRSIPRMGCRHQARRGRARERPRSLPFASHSRGASFGACPWPARGSRAASGVASRSGAHRRASPRGVYARARQRPREPGRGGAVSDLGLAAIRRQLHGRGADGGRGGHSLEVGGERAAIPRRSRRGRRGRGDEESCSPGISLAVEREVGSWEARRALLGGGGGERGANTCCARLAAEARK
jgi:hypothetical protein